MKFAKIGSICSGTLVPADLAWAFAGELNALAKRDPENAERRASANTAAAVGLDALSATPPDEALLSEFVNEKAPAALQEYCAPFTTFGAHPGDGSDFGFWPDIDAVMCAVQDKDGVIKVDAGDAWPEIANDVYQVVEVNDHGNVTLYDAHTKEELWFCV